MLFTKHKGLWLESEVRWAQYVAKILKWSSIQVLSTLEMAQYISCLMVYLVTSAQINKLCFTIYSQGIGKILNGTYIIATSVPNFFFFSNCAFARNIHNFKTIAVLNHSSINNNYCFIWTKDMIWLNIIKTMQIIYLNLDLNDYS